ncbi:inositol polyphosphate multikinase beta-like [Lotus japonicus]|uniref:Inositol polyphosphate multikinase n=1 Tax=Lotus japonicus TaxID=34305 RepID=I3T111_LOTJA|nr:inositol polyphosphate multikinase beta-like [Lotus japonicus]AFK46203.1 unknown [Lotus japonicus]
MLNLSVPENQVAGHKAKEGVNGPLVDDSGKFYKPLQSDERGSNEVTFYTSFSSDPRIPHNIRSFFPIFHGTSVVNAADHLVLEDLLSAYSNPSVTDIKIGSRTWYPEASDDYINKCLQKDRESSSISLGFRISGLKSVGASNSCWQPHKKFLQSLSAEDVKLVMRKFVSSDGNADNPDCVFASEVFVPVLKQLLELKKWFEVQTIFHFYSCSVLVLYEKEGKKRAGAVVKLVDFAHVVDAKGAIDHNFLGGLCSLIKFVSDVLAGVDGKVEL